MVLFAMGFQLGLKNAFLFLSVSSVYFADDVVLMASRSNGLGSVLEQFTAKCATARKRDFHKKKSIGTLCIVVFFKVKNKTEWKTAKWIGVCSNGHPTTICFREEKAERKKQSSQFTYPSRGNLTFGKSRRFPQAPNTLRTPWWMEMFKTCT